MANNENLIPIPGRLHSVATEGHVSGANEIYDDIKEVTQDVLNGAILEEKTYTPTDYSGMGRVVLKKNIVNGVNTLTQDMFYKGEVGSRVPNTNTIFVIQYDFTLGEDITVPANCVLEFEGGSIKGNGTGKDTITGNFTIINAPLAKIFDTSVKLAGRFENGEWDAEWFGVNEGTISNQVFLNHAINQISRIKGGTLIINNDCTISDTIWLMANVSIVGKSTRQGTGTWWPNGGTLIRCAFTNKNKWAMSVADSNGDEISYSQLSFANTNNTQSLGIRLENLTIVTMEDDGSDIDRYDQSPIFGGIRLCSFIGGALSNINIFGFKYGLAISWSWSSSFTEVNSYGKTVGIYFGGVITTLSFVSCSCVRYSRHYTEGNQDMDFSMFNGNSQLIPPYLTANDLKNAAIINDNITGDWQGNNITFTGCCFQGYNAVMLSTKTDAVFTNMYIEAIDKTIIWAYEYADIIIEGQSYELFRGIPIYSGAYEFGGGRYVNMKISNFPACRCYPSEQASYIVFPTRTTLYYDTIINEGSSWSYEKTPQKKFVGSPTEFVIIKDDINPGSGGYKLITPTTSLGNNREVICSKELTKRINVTPEKTITVIDSGNVYKSFEGIIENKKLIFKRDYTGTYHYIAGLYIKNCNVDFPEDTYINAPGACFVVYGKCNINIYSVVVTRGNAPLLKLDGNEPVEVNFVIRNNDVLNPAIINFQELITNRDFACPYNVIVYKSDGTKWKQFTNTSRPTKAVPIGYCYIENGVPIYYTGDTSGSNTGWVDATGTPV